MAFLPAIDACLAAAGEPMDVIYAAHEPGERVFVRLRRRENYQDEGRYDCRVPREPNGQKAVLAPPDMSLRTAGILTDFGIDDKFIRSLAQTLQPGNSALFVLIRKVQPERVLAEMKRFKGRVLRTSLSAEQENRLRAALSDATATVAV
jgi:hypothetical protein